MLWITANALGFGMGFLALMQMKMLIEFGFDWEMHWVWIDKLVNQERLPYLSSLVSVLVGGAIFGSAQAVVIRSRNVQASRWILATVAGFVSLAVAIQWPLVAVGLFGIIPGPAEPISIVVGGGSLAGLFQHFSMRSQGIIAGKWLALWVIGLIIGLVPAAFFFTLIEGPLDSSLSWPAEVFFSGFFVAGTAAAFSAKALFKALNMTRH